jgi:predicted nuclease of predicted toxin-antitoxin system
MRIIADENFPRAAVEALRQRGHDVFWVHTDMPGAPDDAVIAKAAADQRLLVTQDKDFGHLVFVKGWKQSIVGVALFRLSAQSATALAQTIVAALEDGPDFVGQFAVIDEARIRLRPLS